MLNYGFTKEVDMPLEKAIEAVTQELKKEGFGILTKIDVKETLKKKLGVEFGQYVILGACNPSNAHRALLAEENIGLMLPCNVIVYERQGKTVVSIIRPTIAMGMIANEKLREIARNVETQLGRGFAALG